MTALSTKDENTLEDKMENGKSTGLEMQDLGSNPNFPTISHLHMVTPVWLFPQGIT